MLEVRLKAPFDTGNVTIDNITGLAQFDASAPGGAPWPVDPLAFAAPRLTGCVTDVVTVTATYDQVLDDLGNPLGIDQPPAETYRRGDAKADGTVDIADALFGAQYLVGLREIGEGLDFVHPVNAASVKPDGAFDVINTADVLFIAQHLVGLRDDCFEITPPPDPPPTPTPTPIPNLHSHIEGLVLEDFTIQAGSLVAWHNHDGVDHNITSGISPNPDGIWGPATIAPSGEAFFFFTQAGVFPYFCTIHPFMQATMTLTE